MILLMAEALVKATDLQYAEGIELRNVSTVCLELDVLRPCGVRVISQVCCKSAPECLLSGLLALAKSNTGQEEVGNVVVRIKGDGFEGGVPCRGFSLEFQGHEFGFYTSREALDEINRKIARGVVWAVKLEEV